MSVPMKYDGPGLRNVMMNVDSDGEISDSENFQDIRMELNATGHNLTSVLINPRETMYDNLFGDEFEYDQSVPLEYDSPLATAAAQNSIFGFSSHSAVTSMGRSSGAGSAHKKAQSQSQHNSFSSRASVSNNGRTSVNGNMLTSNTLYNTTPAEDAQLDALVLRLKKIFATYQSIHGMENHTDRYSQPNNHNNTSSGAGLMSPRRPSHGTSTLNMHLTKATRSYSTDSTDNHNHSRSPRSAANANGKAKYTKLAGDELRTCYREVPELFFRSDFSLLSPEIFNQTLLIKDVAGPEGSPTAAQNGRKHSPRTGKTGVGRTYSTEDVLEVMQRQGLDGRSHDVLSYYLDLVEVALLRQIWLRSPAFFRALDDIKGLQYQVSETTKIVRSARSSLVAADTAATADPTRIPTLAARQRNCMQLHETLLAIQRVVQGRQAIAALLEAEDYFNAMELISAAKKVYHEQLAGIVALRQLGNQLDDVDNLVCEVMCNKFVSMAIQWEETTAASATTTSSAGKGGVSTPGSASTADILYEELDGMAGFTHATTTTTTINTSSDTTSTQPKLTMEASLKQLLQSLILTERTQSALNMYKSRLLDAIKLIVRTCVMEYLTHFDPSLAYEDNPFEQSMGGSGPDPAYNGQETPFAQKVKEMKAENFLSCLSMCFEHVMVSAHKAALFHQFIEEHLTANIANSSGSSGDGTSTSTVHNQGATTTNTTTNTTTTADALIHSEEYKQVQINMISISKACLTAACDLAQRSISQLINLRKEANAKLIPEKMKFMWEISLNFVLSLEAVSGTTAYIIRQCLQAQTKAFLDYLHETCKGKLVVTLDNERWVQCDVSADRQEQIDRLSSGKAFLAQSGGNGSGNGSGGVRAGASSGNLQSDSAANTTGAKKVVKDKESRPAVVDGVPFKVVWSAMLLTEVIQTYLEVALNFAPVTTDVINKTVEMLRLFDHRARQLVLGAQAIQSAARLKSISVKHLALTGQSLSLLIALLPHIRAALLAQLPPKHQLLLTELDRVSHDLLEHHGQIVAKFVAIVSDHIDGLAASTLRTLDWDHFQGLKCEYFEEVQKAVVNIHRVLQTTLPQTQVQDVFSRIFALLNRKIPAHFEEVNPATQTGRQRILDEITHLVTAFSRIKQIDASALTDSLEETFRKRLVDRRPILPTNMSSSTITNETSTQVLMKLDQITWFENLKNAPGSEVLDVKEWKDEEGRSSDGFLGRDFIHSAGAAVRILDYVKVPASVVDVNGVSTENFPRLVGPAHFTPRSESHRGLCHGGSFCALMDDIIGWMGFCVSGECRPWSGYTVQVNTALKKSVPVNSVVKIEAWVKKREGARKFWISARLSDPENENCVYCEGEGLFLLSPEQIQS